MAGNFLITNVDSKLIISSISYHKGDLCLLNVPGAEFIPVTIRPTHTIKVGERVYTVGNQNGFKAVLASGVIAKKIKYQNSDVLQTNTEMSLGYNGSGLFDADGNLIGITTIKHTDKSDTGETLPTELFLAMISPEQLITAVKKSNSNKSYVSIASATQLPAISYYGTSRVGLIKEGEGCVISIIGRDQKNIPRSIAFWHSETPNSFIIFPSTPNPNDALRLMDDYLQNKSFVLKASDSYMLMDNNLYQLFGDSRTKDNFPLLITEVNKNPTANMMAGMSFKTQMKDQTDGMKTLHYDMAGFSEALAAYKSFCTIPHT